MDSDTSTTQALVRLARERLIAGFRRAITPAARAAVKNMALRTREQARRACLWRWEIAALPLDGDKPYRLVYVGRRENREQTLMHFADGRANHCDVHNHGPRGLAGSVLLGDLPWPGSLRVPAYVNAVVPLKRPIDGIAAVYGDKLRRVIRQQKAHCEVRHAVDIVEIDRVEQEMLRPYAMARHGQDAAQIDPAQVRRIALEHGRLDVVYLRGEPVACHLGYASTRGGKRYWNALRFGFTEAVFSDPKRLHEINSINIHLAMEWAIANDFDYYDIGMSVGRPDDGLLQWKRRRGGHVDASLTHSYIQVKLPKSGVARLLWDSPLFAAGHGALTLHLGLPASVSDEQASFRYREMGFGGLSRVCLYHARPPGEALLVSIQGLFANLGAAPVLETVPVQS